MRFTHDGVSDEHLDGVRPDARTGARAGGRVGARIEGLLDAHTGAVAARCATKSEVSTLTGCVLMRARGLEQAATLARAFRDCGMSAQAPSPRKRQPW